jgi:hypothetical protein
MGVPITGSTGLHLSAVRPPAVSSCRGRHDPLQPAGRLSGQRYWLATSLAFGHHRPCHAGNLIGERDGRHFHRPPF